MHSLMNDDTGWFSVGARGPISYTQLVDRRKRSKNNSWNNRTFLLWLHTQSNTVKIAAIRNLLLYIIYIYLVNLKYAKKIVVSEKTVFLLKMYFLYNNYLFGFWLPFVTFCILTAVCLRNHGTILSEISSLELWANEQGASTYFLYTEDVAITRGQLDDTWCPLCTNCNFLVLQRLLWRSISPSKPFQSGRALSI